MVEFEWVTAGLEWCDVHASGPCTFLAFVMGPDPEDGGEIFCLTYAVGDITSMFPLEWAQRTKFFRSSEGAIQ